MKRKEKTAAFEKQLLFTSKQRVLVLVKFKDFCNILTKLNFFHAAAKVKFNANPISFIDFLLLDLLQFP